MLGSTFLRSWRGLVALVCAGMIAAGLAPCVRSASASAPLFAIDVAFHGDRTTIVVGLPRPIGFAAAVNAAAGRVEIDFDGLTATPEGNVVRSVGLVRDYRAVQRAGGLVRLVLDLDRPAVVSAVRALPAEKGRAARAVIDLDAAPASAMRAESGKVWRPTGSAQPSAPASSIAALILPAPEHVLIVPHPQPPAPAVVAAPAQVRESPAPRAMPISPAAGAEPRPIIRAAMVAPAPAREPSRAPAGKRVIVIDAGHGGVDPGAESVAGYHEKEITLAAARALRRALEQSGRYKIVLTRDSDVYLELRERVARARAAHGDLFISLHADSVAGDSSVRGASIYTLSETASDTETDRLAQRENRADAIGGVDLGGKSDVVANILVDLTIRETVNSGNRLAGLVVDSFRQQGIGLLPVDPHRSAGFAVLKSPDIPSVLIEMGYLSEKSDARDLADSRHQARIAAAIAAGVDRYFTGSRI
jgi:N-acetylmuramoyl-L-alanine amidase